MWADIRTRINREIGQFFWDNGFQPCQQVFGLWSAQGMGVMRFDCAFCRFKAQEGAGCRVDPQHILKAVQNLYQTMVVCGG